MWLPWQYSIVLAIVFAVTTLAMRIGRVPARWRWLRELTQESAIFAALYTVWQWVGHLPSGNDLSVAADRGLSIAHVERVLHLPTELQAQRLALHSHLVIEAANWYYIVGHTPVLGIFLTWLYLRHRDQFPRWRTALAAGCIIGELIQIVAVAPPRLALPGIIDTGQIFGPAVYQPDGAGFAPQLAAMPSLHCVWAITVGAAVFVLAGRGWRWLGPAHIVLTVLAVTVTGNHYWLDAAAGAALVLLGLALHDCGAYLYRRRLGRRSAGPADEEAQSPPRAAPSDHPDCAPVPDAGPPEPGLP